MDLKQKSLSLQPPPLPLDPLTGELDESEVPLDEIQSQFFLLREDGGVGCRFCLAFHTKEQNRPLYPLRDHVHSVHYKIFPYRCNDCGFKTSSYRLSFSHAETTGHRRAIVERKSKDALKSYPAAITSQVQNVPPKKKRKSNPLGGSKVPEASDEFEFILEEEPPASEDFAVEDDIEASTKGTGDGESVVASYVVPSFLPTPPLTLRIQREFFRYDIEGFLQCSKCEFRVQSASTDGPGAKKALLEHVYATHIENLPWTCKDCQFTTKFKSNLSRHCRKMKHEMNEERHAPPGDQEPDARVVAASAKRVKWVGVNLSKELQLSLSQGYENAEHGYSLPKITPELRLSWQLQSEDVDGSGQRPLGDSSLTEFIEGREGKQDTVRLKWTGQSVEPVSLSASATPPRKRKQTPRILPDVKQYEEESQIDPNSHRRIPASKKTTRTNSATIVPESLPDSRLSPDALREKYVLPMENNAGVRCAICDFVIRKTPRVGDPLTFMLSHVCGHLALVLRVTCVACGFMTDNASNWEAHRTESELEDGPLATHEPAFAIAADTK